jgi:hypothetical protein
MGLYETNPFLICGIDSSFVHSAWNFTVNMNISLFPRTLLQEVIMYSVKELETCINSHTIFPLVHYNP